METVEERFATSTPALLPASIARLDQPSTRVEPNPTPTEDSKSDEAGSSQARRTRHSPSPSTPFPSAFSFIPINIPLPAFFAPLPTTLSRTPAFLRQRSLPLPLLLPYSALIRVSAPSIPTLPTNPAPFLCNLSAAFVSLFIPLLPLPNSSSSSGGNAATLPFSSL